MSPMPRVEAINTLIAAPESGQYQLLNPETAKRFRHGDAWSAIGVAVDLTGIGEWKSQSTKHGESYWYEYRRAEAEADSLNRRSVGTSWNGEDDLESHVSEFYGLDMGVIYTISTGKMGYTFARSIEWLKERIETVAAR